MKNHTNRIVKNVLTGKSHSIIFEDSSSFYILDEDNFNRLKELKSDFREAKLIEFLNQNRCGLTEDELGQIIMRTRSAFKDHRSLAIEEFFINNIAKKINKQDVVFTQDGEIAIKIPRIQKNLCLIEGQPTMVLETNSKAKCMNIEDILDSPKLMVRVEHKFFNQAYKNLSEVVARTYNHELAHLLDQKYYTVADMLLLLSYSLSSVHLAAVLKQGDWFVQLKEENNLL